MKIAATTLTGAGRFKTVLRSIGASVEIRSAGIASETEMSAAIIIHHKDRRRS